MTTSQIYRDVEQELLDEKNKYTVVILDENGQKTYENEVSLLNDNPFAFDPSPFLPEEEVMDLPRFWEVAAEVIENAQEREDVVADKQVKLVKDYQPERFHEFGNEVITYKIKRRYPGQMSRDAKSRPQRASNHAYDLRSAHHPNKIIVVESRPIDHKIEFSCWATSSTVADSRALWLEKLFITHAWAFQVQGVERFFWEERGPDTLWKTSEQRLHQRPLVFFVRLREFEVHAHPVLQNIKTKVRTI